MSTNKKRLTLSIQGGQAVGKTTALKIAQTILYNYDFLFEDLSSILKKRRQLQLDINTEEGFIENQRLFINHEVDRSSKLLSSITVFDRGPEDTECYTLNYPKSIGQEWNIKDRLKTELKELRKIRSSYVLYLNGAASTLSIRKDKDKTRTRSTFNRFKTQFYKYELEWFRSLNNVDFLETDTMNLDEVSENVVSWIQSKVEKFSI